MSQPDNLPKPPSPITPPPSPQAPTPAPAPTPASHDSRNAPAEEELVFSGSPSWVGRSSAFFWTFLLAALLVGVPILLRAMTAVDVPWFVLAGGIVLAIMLIVIQVFYHNTIRYRITNYRIDYERGVMTRRIDSLELWYIDHINFRQTLGERLGGVGTIEVITDDPRWRDAKVTSIRGAREVFEKLKSSILIAKRQRGLMELDQN